MHLLPTTLAPLANVCAKGGSESNVRFGATTGVKIDIEPGTTEDRFTAAATDGNRLIIVTGEAYRPDAQPPNKPAYPSIPALENAPNGSLGAIIDAKTWKKTFTDAAKLTSKRHTSPHLQRVAAVFGEKLTTFCATNADNVQTSQPTNIDGQFPNYQQVIPNRPTPTYEITVDPYLLAETLETVAKLGCDENLGVTLSFGKPIEPITIRPRAAGELNTLAVIVPLSDRDGKSLATTASITDMQTEINELKEQHDAAQAEIESLRAELRDRIDELAIVREEAANLEAAYKDWRNMTYDERAAHSATLNSIRAILPPNPTPDSPAGQIKAIIDPDD